jgi:hypothetical protein
MRTPAAPAPSEETLESILASRRAGSDKQQRFLLTAVAIAAFAIGLALVALWQRQLVRTARDQALAALRTQSRFIMDAAKMAAERGNAASAAMLA